MNVLVVENEKPAAAKLCGLIRELDSHMFVVGQTETVEGTVNWLQDHPAPDLIFMDIQLDDGLCFEVFETLSLNIPVVFTTAYDEYMLKAFKVNSVDYLLKPIDRDALRQALEKFRNLFAQRRTHGPDYEQLGPLYPGYYKSRFLVKIGPRYRSVETASVRYVHIQDRGVFLRTCEGKDYAVDYSLDKVQQMLHPDDFFRINRTCMVHLRYVTEIIAFSSNRYQLSIAGEQKSDLFVLSREKVADFKRWMDR